MKTGTCGGGEAGRIGQTKIYMVQSKGRWAGEERKKLGSTRVSSSPLAPALVAPLAPAGSCEPAPAESIASASFLKLPSLSSPKDRGANLGASAQESWETAE